MAMDVPFGGFKQSGIGRQYGRQGFEEYLEIKVLGMPSGEKSTTLLGRGRFRHQGRRSGVSEDLPGLLRRLQVLEDKEARSEERRVGKERVSTCIYRG